MHHPPTTRAKATRLAAVFVAVALCLGAGGFTAMSASAAATIQAKTTSARPHHCHYCQQESVPSHGQGAKTLRPC